jgi:hypothetical protein
MVDKIDRISKGDGVSALLAKNLETVTKVVLGAFTVLADLAVYIGLCLKHYTITALKTETVESKPLAIELPDEEKKPLEKPIVPIIIKKPSQQTIATPKIEPSKGFSIKPLSIALIAIAVMAKAGHSFQPKAPVPTPDYSLQESQFILDAEHCIQNNAKCLELPYGWLPSSLWEINWEKFDGCKTEMQNCLTDAFEKKIQSLKQDDVESRNKFQKAYQTLQEFHKKNGIDPQTISRNEINRVLSTNLTQLVPETSPTDKALQLLKAKFCDTRKIYCENSNVLQETCTNAFVNCIKSHWNRFKLILESNKDAFGIAEKAYQLLIETK